MNTFDADERLNAIVAAQPYPLLFVTVSGAQLYGFPSPDSDYDLRGVYVLPATAVLGLEQPPETMEDVGVRDGLELDLVTHNAAKFFRLLLRPNGYVLEQLYSPLVLHTTPEHVELREIARGCITRHLAHHYLGFAGTQWRLLEKDSPRKVKPLLYIYRTLLTGIHLMRKGEVEASLVRLNDEFRLSQIPELIARKLDGPERSVIPNIDEAFHTREYERLRRELEAASAASASPEVPSVRAELSALLVRLRLQGLR